VTRLSHYKEILVTDLSPGDLITHLETKSIHLVLRVEKPDGRNYYTLTKLNLKTGQVEKEEIISLIAKYWQHDKI